MTVLSATADETYTTRSYVQTGLLAHWDGLVNVGYDGDGAELPHDATSTNWVDLTGHGFDLVQTNGKTLPWDGGNALKRKGSGAAYPPARTVLTMNFDNGYTFDFCGAQTTKAAAYMHYFLDAAGSVRSQLQVDKSWKCTSSDPAVSYGDANDSYSGFSAVAWRSGGVIGHYFPDTELLRQAAFTTPCEAGPVPGTIYLASLANGNNSFLGPVYAYRIYERALTPDEYRWNALVDNVRFRGASADAVELNVDALPDEFGLTLEPAAGKSAASATAPVAISVTGLETSADDGVRSHEYETGIRARFCGWKLVKGCAATPHYDVTEGATESDSVEVGPLLSRLSWDVRRQYAVTATAEHGTVAVGDGAAGTTAKRWSDEGEAVTLTATPDAGYAFAYWTGDTVGAASVIETTLTVPSDRARNVVAVFSATDHEPVRTVWQGAVGVTGDWDDPANWSAGVPQAGDDVVITNMGRANLTLSHSTPLLNSIYLQDGHNAPNASYAQTITLSGWMTCLRAKEITLGIGGVITHAGPYKTEAEASRVWIRAEKITVGAGGKITADGVGYAGNDKGNGVRGYGPAWEPGVLSHPSITPIHAGENVQGTGYGAPYFAPYDDPACPLLPGSGGVSKTAHAGGAIRLEVSDELVVDGSISASSLNGNTMLLGTGGSVWITCRTISGAGEVKANSKNCSAATGRQTSYAAGAGRVAVHYDPAAQAAVADCTVRFEAMTSVYKDGVDLYSGNYGPEPGLKVDSNMDTPWREERLGLQGMGTLYFTDATLLKSPIWRFAGELHTGLPIGSLVFDEPVTFDKCQFVVRDPGLTVTANAGLNVFGAGYYARRELGVVFSNATVTVNGELALAGSRFGVRDGALTVNGDVTLTNAVFSQSTPYLGGELVAFAGPTNGTENAYGATVTVNGDWHVGPGGVVHVESEPYDGAVVKLNANGNLTVDEGGRVDSDMGGYFAGPGSARSFNPGPGHGGHGGGATKTYDNEKEPMMPGSGGGNIYSRAGYTYGGGAVILEVAKKLTLNGLISADSNRKWASYYNTPGAGGTINVRAWKIVGTGKMSAAGGVSNGYGTTDTTEDEGGVKRVQWLSAGGGGRIAVRTAWSISTWPIENACALPGPRGPLKIDKGTEKFDGSGVFPDPLVYDAEPGTVWWGKWGLGAMILVR